MRLIAWFLVVFMLFSWAPVQAAPFYPVDAAVKISGSTVTLDGAWSAAGITQYKLYKNGGLVATQSVTDSYGPFALNGLSWINTNAVKSNGAFVDAAAWPGFEPWENFPYFGHFIGEAMLLTNPTATKNWIKWYMDHTKWPDYSGVNGSVYDYSYPSGVETSRGDYDSIDSYAALFFRLLMKYHKSGGDVAWLSSYSGPGGRTARQVIDGIGSAMTATWTADNLTRAKNWWGPGNSTLFNTMYLMDNTETYQGCVAASYVYGSIYGDSTVSSTYSTKASQVQASEDAQFWQKVAANRYAWAKFTNGTYQPFDNAVVWPDWITNLSMLFWEVIDPKSARGQQLWADFKTYHPNFGTLQDSEQTTSSYGYAGPWPWCFVGVVAAKCGDTAWVDSYLSAVKTNYPTYGGKFGAYNIAMFEWIERIRRQPSFTVATISPTDTFQLLATDAGGSKIVMDFTGAGVVTSTTTPDISGTPAVAASHKATMQATFK